MNNFLPTEDKYREMHETPVMDLVEWSGPKYICPHCGGGMCENIYAALMLKPPMYVYKCNQCGYLEGYCE